MRDTEYLSKECQCFCQGCMFVLGSRSILAGGGEAGNHRGLAGLDPSGYHPGFPGVWDHTLAGKHQLGEKE